MKNTMQSARFWALLFLLLSGAIAKAQATNDGTLTAELRSRFILTQVTSDQADIVTPGTQVQLRVGGLWMYSVAAPSAPLSEYKNGKISMGAGAFGRNMFSVLSSSDGLMLPQHKFAEGSTCWITNIEVRKDGVQFRLYSDPINGTRYFANLKIVFPDKRHIPDTVAALELIAQVLTPVSAPPGNSQPYAAPQPPDTTPPTVTYQDIPPPSPPKDPAAALALGMTKVQVMYALGEPTRKAVIGDRELLFYSDTKMKITLTNGVVSDIE